MARTHALSVFSRRRSPGAAWRVIGLLAKRPFGRSLAWLVLIGIAAFVIVNALVLQKIRHPAPLLAGNIAPLPAPVQHASVTMRLAEAPRVIPLAAPETEPAAAPAGVGSASAPQGSPVRPPSRGRAAPANESIEARAHDAIAQLIGGNAAIGPSSGGAAGAVEASRTIAAVQRALVKIGYVLRTDGVMGTTTRQAIAQFERDRHLPVKGELSPRVRRELTSLSGIPID